MANDSIARALAIGALSQGGGSEPAAYIKSAEVDGETLILTNKDDTEVEFTPENTEYTAGEGISISNNTISTDAEVIYINYDDLPQDNNLDGVQLGAENVAAIKNAVNAHIAGRKICVKLYFPFTGGKAVIDGQVLEFSVTNTSFRLMYKGDLINSPRAIISCNVSFSDVTDLVSTTTWTNAYLDNDKIISIDNITYNEFTPNAGSYTKGCLYYYYTPFMVLIFECIKDCPDLSQVLEEDYEEYFNFNFLLEQVASKASVIPTTPSYDSKTYVLKAVPDTVTNEVTWVEDTVGSEVSGTNDGTNWTSITIDDDTYAIPSGGGSSGITSIYDGQGNKSIEGGYIDDGSTIYNTRFVATGDASIAFGASSKGMNVTSGGVFEASGKGAIATGYTESSNTSSIQASGNGALARGSSTSGKIVASGKASTAFGHISSSTGDCIVASGVASIASGYAQLYNGITASGTNSFARGYVSGSTPQTQVTASGNNSYAIGLGTKNGEQSTALGNNSISIGAGTCADAHHAFVIGKYNKFYSEYTELTKSENIPASISAPTFLSSHRYYVGDLLKRANGNIYKCNSEHISSASETIEFSNYSSSWDKLTLIGETNYPFVIGNGTDYNNRSNALTVDWSGNIVCNNIPAPPSSDGTYNLQTTITDGVATYSWVAVS